MRSDLMNAEVSAQDWEMNLEANPEVPILLFWDRAPWHPGRPIDKVLEENPRLEIIFFPPASLDLNPQEHVWKAARKVLSHNHLEVRLPQLAVFAEFRFNSLSYFSCWNNSSIHSHKAPHRLGGECMSCRGEFGSY